MRFEWKNVIKLKEYGIEFFKKVQVSLLFEYVTEK